MPRNLSSRLRASRIPLARRSARACRSGSPGTRTGSAGVRRLGRAQRLEESVHVRPEILDRAKRGRVHSEEEVADIVRIGRALRAIADRRERTAAQRARQDLREDREPVALVAAEGLAVAANRGEAALEFLEQQPKRLLGIGHRRARAVHHPTSRDVLALEGVDFDLVGGDDCGRDVQDDRRLAAGRGRKGERVGAEHGLRSMRRHERHEAR